MRDVLLKEWVDGGGVVAGRMGTTGAQQEEEGAQREEVVCLEAHAPWLQQSSPNLRRCAREAAATSPPGQAGRLYFAASWTAPAPACQTRFV